MRYTLSLGLLIGFLTIQNAGYSQLFEGFNSIEGYSNYVPNPGFEMTQREYCVWNQNGRKYMEDVLFWDSPTESTPDILSTRLKPTCWANPRKHSGDRQGPRNGDNMAGIKTFGKGGTETFWHEYLLVKLDSTLIPGERYYAEVYVNRAVASSTASNNIGMYFSDSTIVTRDRIPLFLTPQINAEKVVKSRWNTWQKLSGVFEAEKELDFLIIGNFYHDDLTQTESFPEGERGAYYYVDDVTVRRALPEEELTPKPRTSAPPKPKRILQKAEIVTTSEVKLDSIDYKVGNTIKLENIFFEFDKATLLSESKIELQNLVNILTDYPYLHIEISGHTDNVGSAAYNAALSEARAKSVVDYLLREKVDGERLKHKGYGSKQPLTTNETEDGRAQNRRVQFTILSN